MVTEDTSLTLPFGTSANGDEQERPLAVSELLGQVTEVLESGFPRLLVAGEISQLSRPPSGHCYFSLKDESASIDCVMWKSAAARLAFAPAVGDEVVCRGRISVYDKQGRMQFYASAMKPLGEGAANKALEELKRRLEAEGLFAAERKRALPYLPRTIGVVTSRKGAALHDILTTIKRRFCRCRVVVSAATVQGPEAPRELVEALARLEEFGLCDVVIIGRGGGASEDLAAFNDEAVVRAIAAFPQPVVSAVGHEVDFTLADLVADLRSATPTAAAEAVVPVMAELEEEVASLELRLNRGARRYLDYLRHRVDGIGGRLRDPEAMIARARQRTDELLNSLQRLATDSHRKTVGRFVELRSKLDALSPLRVLERGYCLASDADGSLVRDGGSLASGDVLDLRFRTGSAKARVLGHGQS